MIVSRLSMWLILTQEISRQLPARPILYHFPNRIIKKGNGSSEDSLLPVTVVLLSFLARHGMMIIPAPAFTLLTMQKNGSRLISLAMHGQHTIPAASPQMCGDGPASVIRRHWCMELAVVCFICYLLNTWMVIHRNGDGAGLMLAPIFLVLLYMQARN